MEHLNGSYLGSILLREITEINNVCFPSTEGKMLNSLCFFKTTKNRNDGLYEKNKCTNCCQNIYATILILFGVEWTLD